MSEQAPVDQGAVAAQELDCCTRKGGGGGGYADSDPTDQFAHKKGGVNAHSTFSTQGKNSTPRSMQRCGIRI